MSALQFRLGPLPTPWHPQRQATSRSRSVADQACSPPYVQRLARCQQSILGRRGVPLYSARRILQHQRRPARDIPHARLDDLFAAIIKVEVGLHLNRVGRVVASDRGDWDSATSCPITRVRDGEASRGTATRGLGPAGVRPLYCLELIALHSRRTPGCITNTSPPRPAVVLAFDEQHQATRSGQVLHRKRRSASQELYLYCQSRAEFAVDAPWRPYQRLSPLHSRPHRT